MICQIGLALSNLFQQGVNTLLNVAVPAAVQAGGQFVGGLVQRELNRSSRNDLEDAIKSQIRAATNAVSPTAAIGQTAVYSGGPATGSAFAPATLLPPSIQPPNRILQTNPDFFGGQQARSFATTRRPPDVFLSDSQPVFPGTTNVGLGSAVLTGIRKAGEVLRGGGMRLGRTAQQFDPRTPLGRQMIGVGAGAIAAETALSFGADAIFNPSQVGEFSGIASSGDPLRITGGAMPGVSTGIPTGLPRTGNFQREPNGFQVQWYFWDGNMGTQPQPIDRGQAACLKRDCLYRLNVFTSKFIKLKGRRMNPMNVRAFFRAGRRVDAGERICRKMFSEHRKTKTGTVRRKRSRKKK